MKQTAVEFLVKGLPMVYWEDAYYSDLLEKAKEMEKQQIIDAYGVKIQHSIKQGTTVYTRTFGEQYYNKKFKK